jgi:hypothetical protein
MSHTPYMPNHMPGMSSASAPGFGSPAERSYQYGGSQIVLPSPMAQPNQMLFEVGDKGKFSRWKISLSVGNPPDPSVVPPAFPIAAPALGVGLRISVTARSESDVIARRVFITRNDAAVIYAHGRSLRVEANNSTIYSLQAQWGLDPGAPGLSAWSDREQFTIAAVRALNISPFCYSFIVLCPTGTAAPTLTGLDDTGAVVYSEVLAVPRSAEIVRCPGMRYSLTPGGGAATFTVLYRCAG